MAATVTTSSTTTTGNQHRTLGTIQLGTYASGGIAVTAVDFALGVLDELYLTGAGGYLFEFDKSNLKVKAYEAGADNAALDEVSSTDISASIARYEAVGV